MTLMLSRIHEYMMGSLIRGRVTLMHDMSVSEHHYERVSMLHTNSQVILMMGG